MQWGELFLLRVFFWYDNHKSLSAGFRIVQLGYTIENESEMTASVMEFVNLISSF